MIYKILFLWMQVSRHLAKKKKVLIIGIPHDTIGTYIIDLQFNNNIILYDNNISENSKRRTLLVKSKMLPLFLGFNW